MKLPRLLLFPLLLAGTTIHTQAQDAELSDLAGNPLRLEDTDALNKEAEKVKLDSSTPDKGPSKMGDDSTDPAKRAEVIMQQQEQTGDVEKLRKLSSADQKKVTEMLGEAAEFVMGIRVQEAFERLVEVESIAPDLFALHNLKGAAYTKIRNFEKARESFEMAVSIAPRSFMAQFNVTELDFVDGARKNRIKEGDGDEDFRNAEAGFTKLSKQLRGDILDLEQAAIKANASNQPEKARALEGRIAATEETAKLMDFKVLICRQLLGDDAGVKRILDTCHFMDDVPTYYYANAAIAFHQKNDDKARDWIRQAKGIYNSGTNDVYLDSLVEIGWVDSFQ